MVFHVLGSGDSDQPPCRYFIRLRSSRNTPRSAPCGLQAFRLGLVVVWHKSFGADGRGGVGLLSMAKVVMAILINMMQIFGQETEEISQPYIMRYFLATRWTRGCQGDIECHSGLGYPRPPLHKVDHVGATRWGRRRTTPQLCERGGWGGE